ncbi:MAG: hypothetical protein K0S05_2259, partial [Agromyces sp.]|nr:hypothetical protein [Agromyces sp.]
ESDPADLERAVGAQTVAAAFEEVSIRVAALGEDRLMIGAAEAALSPLLADPLAAARD